MHHSRGLRRLLVGDGATVERADRLIDDLKNDPSKAQVEPVDQALLAYAVKLTIDPSSIGSEDVVRLRAHGLDDRAIHDAACCVSYFAFVNRIADGLGVQVESEGETR